MSSSTDPRLLIVALKGLPLCIAAILKCERLPVTQKHLCSMFGSSGKTVANALHRLEEFEIITHSAKGWSVTDNANLLWPTSQEAQEIQVPVDKPVDTCPVDAFPQEKGRKFSDSSLSSSTCSSSGFLTSFKKEKNLLLPELEPENLEKIRLCHKAAIAAGIFDPKAKEISEMAHVSVELIEYHVKTTLAEGKEMGAAIYRIKNNWRVKKAPARDQGRGNLAGKYADFVES